MKRLPCYAFSFFFLLAFPACRGGEEDKNSGEADKLYEASCSIIQKYTDSISAASDSTAVSRLTSECEERLAKLNFEYPPNTDMRLSEGQNDTLAFLTDKFVEARKNRIAEIKRRKPEIPDSLKEMASDSLPLNNREQ